MNRRILAISTVGLLACSVFGAQAENASLAGATTADQVAAVASANQVKDDALVAELLPQVTDNDPTFAGVTVDPASDTVNLYLSGGASDSLGRLIATPAVVQGRLVVHTSKYSRVVLRQARARLFANTVDVSSLGVTGVAVPPDGSGLQIDVKKLTPAVALAAKVDAGVDATVDQADPQIYTQYPDYGSRWADSSPFKAGAATSNACSTGFGVHYPGGADKYILTAAHCGAIGDSVHNGVVSAQVGTITSNGVSHSRDYAVITVPAGKSSGYAEYDGPYNGSNIAKPVTGWHVNAVGDSVCASGAFSGAHCSIVITKNDWLQPGSGYDLEVGATANHTVAGGYGDSGGPVFTTSSADNYATVVARGVVEGGDPTNDGVACPSGSPSPGCSWNLYWTGFYDVNEYSGGLVPNTQ